MPTFLPAGAANKQLHQNSYLKSGQKRAIVNEVKRRFLINALKLFDLGLVVLSFGLAMSFVVQHTQTASLAEFFSIRVKVSNCIIFAIALFCCHGMFSLCGLYESKRLSTKTAEVIEVLKASSLSTFCLTILSMIFSLKTMITPRFLGVFWLVLSVSLVGSRLFMRYWLSSMRRRGHNLHHILILGTNSRAIAFARSIEASPELGYRLLGFVDDPWEKMDEFIATGFNLASNYEHLAEFLRHNVVDEVAIYIPLRSFYEHAAQMAALCEQQGIIMRFDSDLFNLKIARPRTTVFAGDEPQLAAHGVPQKGHAFFLKRAIDIVVSCVVLIVFAPVLLAIALLIRFTSPGPILFGQVRLGFNKRRFTMYKFRSMVPDAERIQEELLHLNEMSGPVFKMRNDPRVTPIGRILRKTSLDELPQLFNVLKGEMSLVGPRALSVRDYQLFNEDWQRRRFSVPPGITCLWQIHGRNSIPFERWMELDMQYIDKWSLWLDLKILAQTIPAVLKGSGAA
ncbi:MAG TPA: sugar transferase [Candidatus Acidoferrales bacterium]